MSAVREDTKTLADLLRNLGDISPSRIRLRPPPGTATEADLLASNDQGQVLCELVEGTLVEKPVGFRESVLAAAIIRILGQYVVSRNLGLVTAPDGAVRLFEGLVRIPDVAFVSWGRIPGARMPQSPIPGLVPDLAIEVLSGGNTRPEMERKRREYFRSGVSLVWEVDPEDRVVSVYRTAEHPAKVLAEGDRLEGEDVVAGFSLAIAEVFAELDRRGGDS